MVSYSILVLLSRMIPVLPITEQTTEGYLNEFNINRRIGFCLKNDLEQV